MAKTPMSFDLKSAVQSAFSTSDRINHYLIEHVPPAAWDAPPPEGKGRSIVAIVAHIHNVRLMWLKAIGVKTLPAKLDDTVRPKDAVKALKSSHRALADVLDDALTHGQVKGFKPDAASFFAYLVAHDAHHRGQIASLARRVGHPIPQSAGFGMWEWNSRSKET